MNHKSAKEIERMKALFAEIGCTLEPAERIQNARIITEAEDDRSKFRFSEKCGKAMYPTESEARSVMRGRQRHGAGAMRIYLCPDCSTFHLTSYIAKKRRR